MPSVISLRSNSSVAQVLPICENTIYPKTLIKSAALIRGIEPILRTDFKQTFKALSENKIFSIVCMGLYIKTLQCTNSPRVDRLSMLLLQYLQPWQNWVQDRQETNYLPLEGVRLPLIGVLSSLNGWVEGSDRPGNLETLPFPFLAFGPISSIMYFHPSIGLRRLNMWVLMKLAICTTNL